MHTWSCNLFPQYLVEIFIHSNTHKICTKHLLCVGPCLFLGTYWGESWPLTSSGCGPSTLHTILPLTLLWIKGVLEKTELKPRPHSLLSEAPLPVMPHPWQRFLLPLEYKKTRRLNSSCCKNNVCVLNNLLYTVTAYFSTPGKCIPTTVILIRLQ